ncbi:hypothetical protein BU14_0256s0006 [Porphyra umbilicalis]|uniref:DUF1232 domain-containing protein n=1 Tax=Porphyra umbilicalis TaxID=2786 RepID=A0A1X6P336_PORUM|nr:hypothetical protein BU14_0256s0006 [Porphyra umbilicalis]|eukprot:OSX75053.1 hypothetical protein BU14_0256s0006 [Porphyra umbilicalis]
MGDRPPTERDALVVAAEAGRPAPAAAPAADGAPTTVAGRAWRWVTVTAAALKAEVLALYLAMDDPRTPWAARLGAALVVGYAASPLDLIPDFIPVLGLLDDLLLLPLGIWLVRAAVPAGVMADARGRAAGMLARGERPPVNWVAGALVVAIWALTGGWAVVAARRWWADHRAAGGG